MNEDAADALLKDLEEPPPYALIVLVADELGPLPPTIRSRCQHVPFRRLSQRRSRLTSPRAASSGAELEALSRVAAGRLDRAERLLDAEAGKRRALLLELARSVYLDAGVRPGAGLERVTSSRRIGPRAARARAEQEAEEESAREREQRARRAAGAPSGTRSWRPRPARRLVPRPPRRLGRRGERARSTATGLPSSSEDGISERSLRRRARSRDGARDRGARSSSRCSRGSPSRRFRSARREWPRGSRDAHFPAWQLAVGVVFSPGGKVYSFDPGGLELAWNEKVICQTSRGQELGRVVKATHELDEERRCRSRRSSGGRPRSTTRSGGENREEAKRAMRCSAR